MRDQGNYKCYVGGKDDRLLPTFGEIDVALDLRYRKVIYNVSLIYGVAVSGTFLILTLLFKLTHFLLHKYFYSES